MPFLEVAQNRYTTKTYNGEIIPKKKFCAWRLLLSTASLGSLFL